MKNILFVGNINSFLISNLAKSIKKANNEIEIDILTDQKSTRDLSDVFGQIYSINNTHILNKIKLVKGVYQSVSFQKVMGGIDKTYDVVHVLYLSVSYRAIWKSLQKISKKQIITVFGGDFYKSTSIMRTMMKPMIDHSAIITATNPNTLNEFSSYFTIPLNRTKVVRFGLSVLEEIDCVTNEQIVEFKSKYFGEPNKTLIACGYNSSTNQNIEKIIPQLAKVQNIKDDYILCFQFAGQKNSVYGNTVSMCEEYGLNYRVFDTYFSDKELAIYRKSIDIMIQLQSTDSFSGAMQEHLYAGTKVITGKWLPYDFLDQENIDYSRISTFDEIRETIENIKELKVDLIKNQKTIAAFSKWSENIDDWMKLY